MFSRCAAYFPTLICVLGLTVQGEAQSPGNIAVQTTIDVAAAAGGPFAPSWVNDLAHISEAANGGYELIRGNYVGFIQQEINARTVDAAEAAGDWAAGPVGGSVAAGLTQGALDIGDLVIAPRIADALVHYFPGVFIPAQTVPATPANPFGVPTIASISRQTAVAGTNSVGNTTSQQSPRYSQIIAIPVRVASAPVSNSLSQALQSPSNAWLVAIMNNPSNDLAARKIAAIALGINPDIITSNPTATALLKNVYGVSQATSAPSVPPGATENTGVNQPNATKSPPANEATDRSPSSAEAARNNTSPVKTIIPGRQSDQASTVTVIKPQAPSYSTSTVQTIIPGHQSTDRSTPGAGAVIASTTPSSPGKLNLPSGPIVPPVTSAAPAVRTAAGGISLSRAAAERLPLNFTLDGAYFNNDRIVLSGRKNVNTSIDAALFLTAVRAACTDSDPYFSLDPDDIAAWLADAGQAEAELSEALKRDLAWHFGKHASPNAPGILQFRTISASRDYPQLWNSILARHRALRSRLVFRPEWLRQTRFGEIMYKADVLLKELAGGATALGQSQLRAASIEGYRSATERIAARELLYQYNGLPGQQRNIQAGGRIWYDLTESSDIIVGQPETFPQSYSELRGLLDRRGLLTASAQQSPRQKLAVNGGAIDLSDVFPRMFVRVRDPVTYKDSSAQFPGLDELVAQANQTPTRYAAAYSEYEQLIEVFRAYIVAVLATHAHSSLCSLPPSELLDAEKVSSPLPAYHPTDFTVTMAWYEYADKKGRRVIGVPGGLFQGGVSIGADRFLENATSTTAVTPIIAALQTEAAKAIDSFSRNNDTGRVFLAFDVPNSGQNTSRYIASNSTPWSATDANRDPRNGEIENAPPPRLLPPASLWSTSNPNMVLFIIALLILGAIIGARPKRQRR